jgi:chitin synthase
VYQLRLASQRPTEILLVVMYYNEEEAIFCRTLQGIMGNVRDIVGQKNSAFGSQDGSAWQNVVVCLVLDGLEPCDKNVLRVLATMGVYQEEVMRKSVN